MVDLYQAFIIHVDGYMVEILWNYCLSWNIVLEHFENLHEKRVIWTLINSKMILPGI
jgi:hypothetical protein